MDFIKLMNTKENDFLRTYPRLGNRIIFMGLGGSYAYGINQENSDIDFRGITLNSPSDLLGLTGFEQYDYEKRLETATGNTTLPDNPDMEKVEKFVEYINRKAIEGDFDERC